MEDTKEIFYPLGQVYNEYEDICYDIIDQMITNHANVVMCQGLAIDKSIVEDKMALIEAMWDTQELEED